MKLLVPGEETEGHGVASAGLAAAIKTILIADLVMSLDSVIAVAAAAIGNTALVIVVLAIPIPLVAFANRLMLTRMDRFPFIITLGAALLGWVAGEMAISYPVARGWVDANAAILHFLAPAAGAFSVVLVRKWLASRAAMVVNRVPTVAVAHTPGRLQRVLLAVDGSEGAAKAVPHLIALRRNIRGMRKLNVQRPVSGGVATFVADESLDDHCRERSEQLMAPARALVVAAGPTPREHRRIGNPGQVIAEVAQVENCDPIVMGMRGLRTHTGALLGSVAQGTAEHAGIPMMLVK